MYTGVGLRKIAKNLRNFGHLWGFDSFQGIPPQEENARGYHPSGHFRGGGYSAADALGIYSLDALEKKIAALATPYHSNLTLIAGFFNDSLRSERVARTPFQPALLVDLDVDVYSSTIEALEWLLSRNLLVPGSFVRYDDWPAGPAAHGPHKGTLLYGQALAHDDITKRYGIRWRGMLNQTRAFQIVSIGPRQA